MPISKEFTSGVLKEVSAFCFVSGALALLAAMQDTNLDDSCAGAWQCTLASVKDREYLVRCAISLPIAVVIYLGCGYAASTLFPRAVRVRGARPPVWSLTRWDADVNTALLGLISGTPMIQLFHHAADKYGPAMNVNLYKSPLQHGILWAFAQIPVYLLLWDFVFYVLHRWFLHSAFFYKMFHAGHHTFRPPCGWSGIAVGPLDVIFEGILPYTVPLFCGLPFHEYTVNGVNALLTLHACVLHSSCHREYGELSGVLGWLMISPIGHNKHHEYGVKNACNFAPIFKIWDRVFGTLNDTEPFWWKADRRKAQTTAASAAENATAVLTLAQAQKTE